MLNEREVLGVPIRYEDSTGELWRWIVGPGKDGLNYPRWMATGLSTNSKGAKSVWINDRSYLAHRVAWFVVTGQWPKATIDHINWDRGDNKWANLRDVSMLENNHNRKRTKKNTSGITGVTWVPKIKKWRAAIDNNKSRTILGFFSTLEEANAERKAAEVSLGFHKNHGRSVCV